MNQIAILVETSRTYGRRLIEGVAAYAQSKHTWILRRVSSESAKTIDFSQFDGIIARIADDALAQRILQSGRPVVDVFCQKPRIEFAGVDSDHRQIGIMAREFFTSHGFLNFAYCGFPGTTFSDLRERAFADSTTLIYTPRTSFVPDDSQFYNEQIDKIPDARDLARWLKSLPTPIAIFCCNDLRAIQLQRVACDLGLNIPKDVAILGVDNDMIACSFAKIPISSINPNSFEIGKAAARILEAMIIQPPAPRSHKIHFVKPAEIIERTSTDFMPIDPPWLGQALLHIKQNMTRPVPASEIFALAQRSSTFVEVVFKNKLGMPVQAYITSVKMREARRLISDPNLRISEIANLCGFSSPQYFCRTFTTTFKMSPRRYRQKLLGLEE